jgi:hypothetical protein
MKLRRRSSAAKSCAILLLSTVLGPSLGIGEVSQVVFRGAREYSAERPARPPVIAVPGVEELTAFGQQSRNQREHIQISVRVRHADSSLN